jgi:echinoderm microtubule-associated protein-like 1/2
VVAAEWHPVHPGVIVTCGKSHIAFWTHELGGTLIKRNGIFEGREKPKYVTCLAFTQDGEVLSGDSNGNIIAWVKGKLLKIHFKRLILKQLTTIIII